MRAFRMKRAGLLAALPALAMSPMVVAAGCSSDAPVAAPSSQDPVPVVSAPHASSAVGKIDSFTRALRQAPAERVREMSKIFNVAFENGEPRFAVLVKMKPRRSLVASSDLRLGAQFGKIVSVYSTRAGIDALEAHPDVLRVEAVRRMQLLNDISTTRSSVITRSPTTPAQELAIPAAGGSVVVPFTPASNEKIGFKMSKMGVNGVVVDFTSTITVCGVLPVAGVCATPLVSATGNGPGGDAVTTPTAFTSGTKIYVLLSGAASGADAGAGQPTNVNVALTVSGDSSQGFVLGTKARDSGNDGTGVIFADVDTGIDFCHPDFIDPNTGKTRIKFLWDHSLTPQGSEHAPVEAEFAAIGGVEYTEADINASLASCNVTPDGGTGPDPFPVRMRDIDAHGTHTAGTASGNGSGTPYVGAAPKVDIIAINGLGAAVTQTAQSLPEAIKYALVRAKQLGEPVAMNNSWGSFGDEGDGLTLFEEMVSSVAGQGSIAVFAAGNSAGVAAHATSTVPPVAAGTADPWYLRMLTCDPAGATNAPCTGRPVSLWIDPKDTYTITLKDDGGNSQTWAPAEFTTNGTAKTLGTAASGGSVTVTASGGLAPGGYNLYFDIPAATSTITARVFWTITMTRTAGSTGSGVWDAYLGDGEHEAIAPYNTTVSPVPPDPPLASRHVTHLPNASNTTGLLSSTYTPGQIGQPSTALGVVSVGATTGNLRWLDNSAPAPGGYTEPGDTFFNFNALGNFTYFSARGPSRDGRALPNVGAPGMNVVSANSQFGGEPPDALVFNPAGTALEGQHAIFSGTSMATPNVTGAAVLMLQEDPTAFPRPLIENTAAHDALTDEDTATTGVPVQGWNGAGKVDAVAAIAALAADVAPTASKLVAGPAAVTAGDALTLTVTAADSDGTVQEYLWDVDGDGYTDFFTNSKMTTPNVLVTTAPDANESFTAKVIVVDNFGKTAVATASYTVSGAFDAGVDAAVPVDAAAEGGKGGGGVDAATDAPSEGGKGGIGDAGVPDSTTGPISDDSGPGVTPDSGPIGTEDSGPVSTEDSGVGEDGGTVASGGGGGCGCVVAGSNSSSKNAGAGLGGLLLGLGIVLRRRNRRN